MSFIVLKAHSDGWRLLGDAFPEPEDRGWPRRPVPAGAPPRLRLEGLLVTLEQARAICADRPRGTGWSGDWRGTGPWPLMLEVTLEEGMAIWRGHDPLAVLLPRYRARALTREELTG